MPGKSNDSPTSVLSTSNKNGVDKKDTFFGKEEAKPAFFTSREGGHSFFPGNGNDTATPSIQRKCSKCEKEEQTAKEERPDIQTKAAFESDADAPEALQTKLKVGKADDHYEQEADSVADKVVKKISGEQEASDAPITTDAPPTIQSKCSKCGGDMGEREVQTKAKQSHSPSKASANISDRLSQRKGKGAPMEASSRSTMENAFGADFKNVNIHQDKASADLNKSLNAKAFTHGNDIFFGENNYQPSSKEGQTLLAHELTHTIHQGAAIQKKTNKSSESSEDKLQRTPEERIQKVPCPVVNIPGEQPAEGQQEPEEEEQPAEVEAEEGASVEERQEEAPDCEEFAPPETENIAEDAASQIPEENADTLEQSEQQAEQSTQETGEGGRSAAQNQAAIGQATAGEESFSPDPAGLGEAASPEVQNARDTEQGKEQAAIEGLLGIQGTLGTLQAGNVSFMDQEIEDEHEAMEYQRRKSGSESIANQFLSNASAKVQAFIDAGMALPTLVLANNAEKEARLQAAIQQKRAQTTAAINTFKAQARAKAASARARIRAKHTATVIQIIAKTVQAKATVEQDYQASSLLIEQERLLQLQQINSIYADADHDFRAVGPRVAQVARSAGNQASAEYAARKTGRKTGFWDGYLVDNQHQARADSAQEVGEQYAEGMTEEANKQADCAMEGKPKDIETVHTIADQTLERLQLTKDATISALSTAQQNAIDQAGQTKESLLSSLSASLNATLSSLEVQEGSQLQLINDYGVRQSMAIVRDGLMASASIVQGVNQAAAQLVEFLSGFSAQIAGMQAPEPSDFQAIVMGFEQQFEANVVNAMNLTEQSAQSTAQGLEMGALQALLALDDLTAGGIANAQQLKDDYVASTNQLVDGAINGFDQQMVGYTNSTDSTVDSTLQGFSALLSGIQQSYLTVGQNLRDQFSAKVEQMESSLLGVLNDQLENKICEEAEKAAEEVQPWWKTALKILLVIVVIVVIALVIGPAVIGAVGAAAGALGASAGAATFIGAVVGGAILGAASGAVMQIGNNLIDGKDWDEGVVDAIIAGAITGAIGGFLGGAGNVFAQRLADAGRLGASGLMQSSLKFGIEMAFDTAGNVLGDLVMGNPITLEGIAQGAAMGAAVTLSTANLSSFGRLGTAAEGIQQRSMGLGERVGGAAGRLRPNVDAPSTRVEVDSPTTRPEVDGPTARPDAESSRPRPEAEGPAPRPDAEGPSPRPEAEGGSTRRPETEQDAADARVREEIESLGPMSKETQEMLANNPRLREALLENPMAAAALKKCTSPCIPSNATEDQVRGINDLIASRGGDNFPDTARLREFLRANEADLDGALARLNADYEGTLRPPSPEQSQSGREMARARGLDDSPNPPNPPVPDSQSGNYEWYRGRDGSLQVRNKPGNDGPALRYDAESGTFEVRPRSRPTPDRRVEVTDRSKVSRSEVDPADQQNLARLEQARREAHQRKQDATAAGDAEATSRAHGELVRASEALGEAAGIAAMRRQHPNAEMMDTSLPGRQQSGEFDQVYRDGDQVYVVEAKGGGSTRGSRQTAEGPRAEQGTPEYIQDIELNMQQSIDTHRASPRYQTDEQFRLRIDRLQDTVDAISLARETGNLHSMQVSQRVRPDGSLNPDIEITTFDPSSSN